MSSNMKDSDIEWIGEIPSHWDIIPNKYIMHKIKDICITYKNEDILSLSKKGVNVRDFSEGGKMPATFDGYQKIYAGNLLMCLFDIDVTPRCVGVIKNDGLTSPAYSQFVLNDDVDVLYYYYYYLMLDEDKTLVHLSKNLRHSITEEQLGTLKVIKPPLNEQKNISRFLDEKITIIDNEIDKLVRLIKKYNEYKQSLITEVVTRGLDNNVKMKDSNIDWIGEIPEHWRISRGKGILTQLKRNVNDNDEVITCFRDGEVTLRSKRREIGFTMSDKEIGYQGIEKDDLVVHGMDGFAGSIGISDSRGKASPVLIVLNSNQNKKYLMYYLRSLAYNNIFLALTTGIRVRSCNLNWDKLSNLSYLIPPSNEQKEIVEYLDKKCILIDSLISEKEQLIKKLEDYKKSLIFEYVTGKKEVPNEI